MVAIELARVVGRCGGVVRPCGVVRQWGDEAVGGVAVGWAGRWGGNVMGIAWPHVIPALC